MPFTFRLRRALGRLILWAIAPVAHDLQRLQILARQHGRSRWGDATAGDISQAYRLYGVDVVDQWQLEGFGFRKWDPAPREGTGPGAAQ